MNDKYKLFFELIRVALGNAVCLSHTPTNAEWMQLYELAKKQSLVGICFAGVQKTLSNSPLKGEDWDMPEQLYLQWMGMAAKIQQMNETLNRQCAELQARLSADGLKFCIVKGQTNAVNYTQLSALRQPGDIDVWVDADRTTLAKYVQSVAPTDEISDTHIQFHIFKDTEVELHYCLTKLANPFKNRLLKRWLKEQKASQMSNQIVFGEGHLYSPTTEFNMVYQMLHIYKHLFGEGIGLRQLMDYYFVLKTLTNSPFHSTSSGQVPGEDFECVQKTISDLGLTRFAEGLMWVMQHVFGLSMINVPWIPNEREGRFLLDEIMQGGNFGKQDTRFVRSADDSHLKRYLQLLYSKLRFINHFPVDAFWISVDYFFEFFRLKIIKSEIRKYNKNEQ